ncbi:aldehyde dehydrogenase family protein [Enterococcus crotali]|uniref:aldehyde dehydrogenase family protein n=1 Tax=Enterococcus crotali TaxID=1453587 RepID=UPI0004712B75|nr:aldehyde dehydrogenase family protein [Enterococcus crotali]
MQHVDKDLLSIQEARILIETARDAQQLVKEYEQKNLDKIVKQLLKEIEIEISRFLATEIEETKMGCYEEKQLLSIQFLKALSEELDQQHCVGNLVEDSAGNVLQVGVPLGVIPVLLPAENVTLNTIYSLTIGIKSGNAILLIPHPNAQKTTYQVFQKIKEISEMNGLPKGCLGCVSHVTENGVKEILASQDISMIIAIGKQNYINAANYQRPIIYGGAGATPVFIERSADLKQAVEAIIYSRSYDCGLLPATEQYLIAEGVVASKVKELLQQHGAHFLSKDEESNLLALLQPKNNQINPTCVGKDALWLAQAAQINVAPTTKVLVSEQQYMHDEDPFANEIKCPVLAFYLEPDWIHACEKSIRLLKEKNNGHTLAIHSKNKAVLKEFALKKPVGRMIVNAPASTASLGLESTLPVSFILGGFTTGRGISAKNITATDLTYIREIGYPDDSSMKNKTPELEQDLDTEMLKKILIKIMEN